MYVEANCNICDLQNQNFYSNTYTDNSVSGGILLIQLEDKSSPWA